MTSMQTNQNSMQLMGQNVGY